MTKASPFPPSTDEWLLLAIANTGHVLDDELRDAAAVTRWWRDLEDAPRLTGVVGSEEDVAVLRAARSTIRAVALRNNGVARDCSEEAAALGELVLAFSLGAHADLAPVDDTSLPRHLASRAVVALVRASAGLHWHRVKACPGPDCAWVFVDASRNGSRRWCDMAQCGNRAKGKAFRSRAKGSA